MNEHIARLGFDAWADNQFVNAIEDFVEGVNGSVTIESVWEAKDHYRINVWWDEKSINSVIAAYAEGKWQNYEKQIKRPQETL